MSCQPMLPHSHPKLGQIIWSMICDENSLRLSSRVSERVQEENFNPGQCDSLSPFNAVGTGTLNLCHGHTTTLPGSHCSPPDSVSLLNTIKWSFTWIDFAAPMEESGTVYCTIKLLRLLHSATQHKSVIFSKVSWPSGYDGVLGPREEKKIIMKIKLDNENKVIKRGQDNKIVNSSY